MLGIEIQTRERKYIMNNIDNKELLLAAIDDYEPYTKSQKKLLQAIVNIEVGGSLTTSITSLSKTIGYTRAMTYIAVDALEKDGILKKTNTKQARVSTFEINFARLRTLMELYIKKQDYLAKKDTKHSNYI